MPRDISVVSLDAHLDFREIYENESYNHACVTRRIADHIGIKNVAVLGIRSAEKEEFEERASIMEYDGQLSKEEAEWRALRIILENRLRIAV